MSYNSRHNMEEIYDQSPAFYNNRGPPLPPVHGSSRPASIKTLQEYFSDPKSDMLDDGDLLIGVPDGNSAVQSLESSWLSKQQKCKKRTKWLIAVGSLLALLLIGGGIATGVILSEQSSDSSSSTDSSSVDSLLNNPQLHQVFYGIDYTPANVQYQYGCGASLNEVQMDIAVLSQLTTRIRLYGTDCNQTDLVIQAIQSLNVEMELTAGIWLDNNVTTNQRQISQFWDVIDSYGDDIIKEVAVGNEVLYRQDMTQSQLIDYIDSVKSGLASRGYSNVLVGTSDLGSNWDSTLASNVDLLMANVHPFFGEVDINDAANWTWSFFNTNDVAVADAASPVPDCIISETGWPSGGGTNGASVAGIPELQEFLNTFVCQSNQMGYKYYYFEGFDEPWKAIFNTPTDQWETQWGLLTADRQLKDGLVIPTCS